MGGENVNGGSMSSSAWHYNRTRVLVGGAVKRFFFKGMGGTVAPGAGNW